VVLKSVTINFRYSEDLPLIKVIAVVFCTILSISCSKLPVYSVQATDAKIGITLNDQSHVVEIDENVPGTTQTIYLEFFLEAGESSQIPLIFNWYVNGTLFNSSSGLYPTGYVIAFVERDLERLARFPAGVYTVEVIFYNTKLLEKSFIVQD